jgi:hypothetical protein
MSSDETISPRDYSSIAPRVLNRKIRDREQQIAAAEAGKPTSKKTIAQLQHEKEQMLNALMERSLTKVSETKD